MPRIVLVNKETGQEHEVPWYFLSITEEDGLTSEHNVLGGPEELDLPPGDYEIVLRF
jgi:hypothetical protein